jgi:subtilisin-like proprotein convertase family protein
MKLRIKLAILFAVLTANASYAQDCSTDNYSRIILESQSEIDDFQSLYGPCSNVPGTLFIGGFNGQVPGIFDIDGLTGITSIQGELSIIRVPDLSSIGGLSALTYIGENLSIESAPSLTSLQPLANLSSPLTGLSIQGTGLTNLDGLEGVPSLDYRPAYGIYIVGNSSLINLDALSGLTNSGLIARLNVSGNASLESFDGLSALQGGVEEFMSIDGGSASNLDGLRGITEVGDYFTLSGTSSLTDCTALAALLGWPDGPPNDAVGGTISITNNDSSGCNSVGEIIASVNGPSASVIESIAAQNGALTINFTEAQTVDRLYPVTEYQAYCSGEFSQQASSSPAAIEDNIAVDDVLSISGFGPVASGPTVEVDVDITHSRPNQLVISLISPEGVSLVLWDQAGEGTLNIAETFIIQPGDLFDLSGLSEPLVNGDWILNVEDRVTGTVIREGTLNQWTIRIEEKVIATSASAPITLSSLINGRSYACDVKTLFELGEVSSTGSQSSTPQADPPSELAITNFSLSGNSIEFELNAVSGGALITQFDALCSDGIDNVAGSSDSSTVSVTGLSVSVAYACEITATNAGGTSEPVELDLDMDGLINSADTDDDGDNVPDQVDAFPWQPLYSNDQDADQMPDAWELLYGLDPNNPSDRDSDQDGDGVVAYQEFIDGTIPAGSLDMDGNGQYDALTDGLLLLRGMFGLTGNSMTNGAVATNALYTTAAEIEPRINVLGELADIDGNGQADALTDGLLVLRYLFGLRDSVLVNGVVSPNGTRVTSAEIQDHMQGLMPDVEPQPNPEPEKIFVRLNGNPFAAPYYIFSSTANGSSITPILEKGKTYIFERTDSGHPFNLGTGWRSGLSGVTMSSTASSGVVSNVGSIQVGEAITITIPQSFGANSIKYYCYLHSGMVSSISIAQ